MHLDISGWFIRKTPLEREQKPHEEAAIQFLSGPLAQKIIGLSKDTMTIGREEQNDIVVPDAHISRRHARIYKQHETWLIENLSQSSAISIDQQRLSQGTLQNNSKVSLGETISFVFLIQAPETQPSMDETILRPQAELV